MRTYYNSLVVMMIVTTIACFLSPSAELAKKDVRPVCGLLLLLTLVSPLSDALSSIGSVDFSAFSPYSAGDEQLYAPQAYAILEYISDKYGIAVDRVVFITDESGELSEIQLFTGEVPYNIKEAAANSLEGEYGCEVRLYCGEE